MSCLGLELIFATPLVRVTALVIAAIIIVRTSLEDQMLQENLEGYTEYSNCVVIQVLSTFRGPYCAPT